MRWFFWIAGRYWLQHKLLTFLNVLTIALGVAVFLSIQIINHSASASFRATVNAVSGKANFQIAANGAPFDEAIYSRVRFQKGVRAATPVVEETLPLAGDPADYLRLLGVDPFSNDPFQVFQIEEDRRGEAGPDDFFFVTNAVSLTAEFARRRGLEVGDTLEVRVGEARRPLSIVSLLSFEDPVPGLDEHLAVMDIANAQELLGRIGRLDRIDLLTQPDFDLAVELPPHAVLDRPDRRSLQVDTMLQAFQLNLTALSFTALFVGMFLIYNTVTTEVVRRRRELGLLRAIGMSPRQVEGVFVGQAMLSGGAGILLGIGGGVALAQLSLGTVERTISSFYLLASIEELFVPVWLLGLAAAVGMGAVIVAAWRPAHEAARLSPVTALNPDSRPFRSGHAAKWSVVGLLILVGAYGQVRLAQIGGPPWLGFGAALFLLIGVSCMVPASTVLLAGLLRPCLRRFGGGPGEVALTQLRHSLNRTGVTIAALGCALAMMMGVSAMIHSFRMTIEDWIRQTVKADIYISPASQLHLGPQAVLPTELLRQARDHPGIEAVEGYQEMTLTLRGRPVRVGGSRFDIMRRYTAPPLVQGDRQAMWSQVIPGEEGAIEPAGIVSESLARHLNLSVGDRLDLPTPKGMRALKVAAVYRDYTTDVGVLQLDQYWMNQWWGEGQPNGLALYLKPDQALTSVTRWIRKEFSPQGELRIYSNRTLRDQIFEVFDQTFAITYLLRLTAGVVAVLGIFLTLTTLVTERGREIGILRSIGAAPRQVQSIVLTEAGLIGFLGYVMGLAAGLLLAWLLIEVINPLYFGWTIQWHWPAFVFVEAPLLALAAAWIAGWLPARRAARQPVAEAVREE